MARKSVEPAHIDGQLSLLESELAAPLELPAPSTTPDADSRNSVTDVAESRMVTTPTEAPISGPNTRIRAGNAMQRARAAAIAGAVSVLARHGVKAMTMADVADAGGLARATMYNHVRDKQSLLQLVLAHEVRELAKVFSAASTMSSALTGTARAIADHPALIGIRSSEPLALAAIAVPTSGEAWDAVRELMRQALVARGAGASSAQVDLVLRWLASFVTEPSDEASRASQAAALAKSLR